MSDLDYDPYSEEALRDPYAIYKRLRAEKPAYYIEKYDAWALSRFEDIWNASLDMSRIPWPRQGRPPGIF